MIAVVMIAGDMARPILEADGPKALILSLILSLILGDLLGFVGMVTGCDIWRCQICIDMSGWRLGAQWPLWLVVRSALTDLAKFKRNHLPPVRQFVDRFAMVC